MPRTPLKIRSMARVHTETAINVLAGIMNDPKAPTAPRVQAAQVLLDRGWGKAEQTLTLEPGQTLIEILTRARNGTTLDIIPDSVRDGDDGGEPRSLADFSAGEPSEE